MSDSRRCARFVVPVIGLALLIGGCAGHAVGVTAVKLNGASATGKHGSKGLPAPVADIRRTDPLAYLRQVEERAARLQQYRLTFWRQERLGLAPRLGELERITVDYRKSPFSVKFVWLDDDSEYTQVVYVHGKNDNKVVLLPRRGLFGLKPAPGRFRPEDAVAFGKSRNVITDFGLHRMIQRTLKRIADAVSHGGAKLRYVGLELLEGRPAHRFELQYPKADIYPNKRQDLYVDAQTELPLGTYLWLPNGDLDALYLYLDLREYETPPGDEMFTIVQDAGGRS